MKEEVEAQDKQLRQYLLGELSDEEQQKIEAQLLIDNQYLEQLLITEEDLIDDYSSGKLSPSQQKSYQRLFLATPEGQQKLRITKALNNHLGSFRPSSPSLANRLQTAIAHLFSPSAMKIAAALLILALGVLNWSLFFHQSDLKRGINALSDAYREQRPVEARVTGLPYAPFSGASHNQFNTVKLRAADKAFHNLNGKDRSPAALHALGRYFLTEKNFSEAIVQLSDGVKAAPNDASLHVDLGVAFMEAAQTKQGASMQTDLAAQTDFAASRNHFEEALKLQPDSPEALFNLALLNQTRKLWKEAEEGWKRYLAVDAKSRWAEEARRYLKSASDAQNK